MTILEATVLDEDAKERRRTILFWVFVGTFTASVTATLFVFVTYQVARNTPIPLLRELVAGVVIQAAVGVIALWRNLFGLSSERKSVADKTSKVPRGSLHDAADVMEQVLLDVLSSDIADLRLIEATRRVEVVRRSNAALISDKVRCTEIGVRGLLGHGPYITSHLKDFGDVRQRQVLQFEPALLNYATRDNPLRLPKDLQGQDKGAQTLWYGLAAIDAVNRNDAGDARQFFDLIDHNIGQDGRPLLNPFDRARCYSAIPIAVTAAFLGDEIIVEEYLNLAKSIKQNAHEFGSVDYPLLAPVAELHHAFVRTVLGVGAALNPKVIRAMPGQSHVLARHCQVLVQRDKCLATLESVGAGYAHPIRAGELRERLIKLERSLRTHSVHVVGGSTAGWLNR